MLRRTSLAAGLIRRPILSKTQQVAPFWSSSSSAADLPNLDGKFCWVVGGAGIIGTGIVRGLLRAGATVICNSRYKQRLDALTAELGHPEKLVAYQGSMLADGAEETVANVMELTAGQLDHVVTHSAVRWWGRHGGCDETGTIQAMDDGARGGKLLDMSIEEFSQQAVALPQMQFAAARLLVPRLQQVEGASYTFVTGGAGESARSAMGQINAQAVWGLAAAMRSEAPTLKVAEVRVGLKFNRSVEERREEPRDTPLSHDIGTICAGLAAAPMDENWKNALHNLDSNAEVALTKSAFPALCKPYSVFFTPSDNFM